MRVIITGGTGYIGTRLVASLAGDGHEVIVLSRDPGKAGGLPAGARVEPWDARTAKGWGHLADGAGAIVNLAGARMAGPSPKYRWTDQRKKLVCESRRDAGHAVTEAIREAADKPGVLVQASGIDYYQTGDAVRTEEAPAGTGFLSYVCHDCWETSTEEVPELSTRRAVIRIAPVLGPDSTILSPLLLQHKLFAGGRIGSGQQWFSWVHIDDVVRTIRFLIDRSDASGAFNLCTPNPVTNQELSRTLGSVLGRPSWLPAPAFAFRLAFGEMADTLLKGVRGQPERLEDLGFDFKFPALEPALRDIVQA
jgi:hypothetical protein